LVTLHDGRPVPKVIDFGVAKAIDRRLIQETLFTRFAEMIGTPLYMSPEQAEMTGLDIDTRADIYSLGVLLYELLTGSTPFDKERLRRAAFDEIRQIIREEEPPKPSTRISTLGDTRAAVAAHRHADPQRLSQVMVGNLDWIVMKTLEKDRTRRYETANGLAMDVERYLADEPVEASPPSATYRFRKFARRNKVALATGGLVAASLAVGTGVSTWQAIRATRAERSAEVSLQAETQAHGEAEIARQASDHARRTAEEARQAEAAQRQIAERARAKADADAKRVRRLLYVADLDRAQQSWKDADIGRVLELLTQHEPNAGKPDLRGWEWHYLWKLCHSDLRSLKGHSSVASVAFSRAGRQIASGSNDGRIEVWDAEGGTKLATLKGHAQPVRSVAFSPDGERIASGSNDKTIKLWDATSGAELATLQGHSGSVWSVAFSPDGERIASATAGTDGIVRVWDSSKLPVGKRLNGARGSTESMISSASYSPDGRKLLVTYSPWTQSKPCRSFVVWDTSGKQPTLSYSEPGKKSDGTFSGCFSPDGRFLAVDESEWLGGRFRSQIRILDALSQKELSRLKGYEGSALRVLFSPDGQSLVAVTGSITTDLIGERTRLQVWKTDKLGVPNSLRESARRGDFLATAVSPDGKLLATNREHVEIYDFPSLRLIRSLPFELGARGASRFSPDGRLLASGGDNGEIHLWDLKKGEELMSLRSDGHAILSLAFSPDGTRLAAGLGGTSHVELWHVTSGRRLTSLPMPTQISEVTDLSFSPDQRTLVSVGIGEGGCVFLFPLSPVDDTAAR
jgi:eukaryotic-like serine/threonine-protein kinase